MALNGKAGAGARLSQHFMPYLHHKLAYTVKGVYQEIIITRFPSGTLLPLLFGGLLVKAEY